MWTEVVALEVEADEVVVADLGTDRVDDSGNPIGGQDWFVAGVQELTPNGTVEHQLLQQGLSWLAGRA